MPFNFGGLNDGDWSLPTTNITPIPPGMGGDQVNYTPAPRARPGFTFGDLSAPNSIFYNDPSNRGVGWQMLKDYLNTGVGNPRYNSYLDSRMSDEYNRYLSQNAQANGALKWTDYLQANQNQVGQGWADLTTAARGGNPGLYGANQRFLG